MPPTILSLFHKVKEVAALHVYMFRVHKQKTCTEFGHHFWGNNCSGSKLLFYTLPLIEVPFWYSGLKQLLQFIAEVQPTSTWLSFLWGTIPSTIKNQATRSFSQLHHLGKNPISNVLWMPSYLKSFENKRHFYKKWGAALVFHERVDTTIRDLYIFTGNYWCSAVEYTNMLSSSNTGFIQ